MIRSSKRRELPGGAQTVQLAPVEVEAIVQAADLAAGSRPVKLGGPGTPTVALTAVEIDALVQSAETGHKAADPNSRPTVENIRIARGTEPQPATIVPPRGPRRARETLRADTIKGPGLASPPTRKR
ncbi:MAG TPA: hypothetical protein VGD80_18160 [Kofleriaceae bacterium]